MAVRFSARGRRATGAHASRDEKSAAGCSADRDQLRVDGPAALEGTLWVFGYRTVSAREWAIITANSVTGTFSQWTATEPTHELVYTPTRVLLRRR